MISPTAEQGILSAWLRKRSEPEDSVALPQLPATIWVHRLLWAFMMSFAFDYRSSDTSGGGGAGIEQILFLLTCMGSTAGIFILGWKYLIVRPGAWFLGLWICFLVYMAANSILQGVVVAHWFRMLLPLSFCFAGMMNAHIAGCMGIRPGSIVKPIFVAACINIIWRIVQGVVFGGFDLSTVRIEVQSPSSNWLAAWIACAILLRGRFHPSLLVAVGVLFIGIFITVTRSLLFPIFAASLASGFCFLLSVFWGNFVWLDLVKRLIPVALVGVLGIALIGLVAVIQPEKLETWNERLFHNSDERNMPQDISYLTRRAEADSLWKEVTVEPEHIINGRGIGASYDWDASYMREISVMIPIDDELGVGVWAVAHSTWTYALFSGGIIAVGVYAFTLIGTMVNSIKAARANSTDPGPDQWLAFLPFIATVCALSETLTSNPFNERLAGITFGMMVGLSQSFLVRASWIHMSEQPDFQRHS